MSGWTPGPWRVDIVKHANWHRANYAVHAGPENSIHTRFIADLGCDGERREDNEEANARLIAAAPALYEALSAMLPSNVALGNDAWPDNTVVPIDFTLGELRAARAALRLASAS